ncbi:MAG: neutral zinc metallopeptidase, partial [Saprospiraceae bacterium]
MRWQESERSKNVDDRRGQTMKRVGGGIGIGAIIMAVLALFLGGDPMAVLQNAAQSQPAQTQQTQSADLESREDYALGEFVKVVLKETEDVWNAQF